MWFSGLMVLVYLFYCGIWLMCVMVILVRFRMMDWGIWMVICFRLLVVVVMLLISWLILVWLFSWNIILIWEFRLVFGLEVKWLLVSIIMGMIWLLMLWNLKFLLRMIGVCGMVVVG